MIKAIEGKTISEANSFLEWIKKRHIESGEYLHQEYNHEYLEYFEMISSLSGYPSRQMCASLPWKAWDQLINKDVR